MGLLTALSPSCRRGLPGDENRPLRKHSAGQDFAPRIESSAEYCLGSRVLSFVSICNNGVDVRSEAEDLGGQVVGVLFLTLYPIWSRGGVVDVV